MIFVTGDTHGNSDIENVNRWYSKNHQNLTSDDILIQLGDWGAVWHTRANKKEYMKDLNLQMKWSKKKFTTLVVLGNHENYNLIKKLPLIEKWGGKMREFRPHNPYNRDKEYKALYLLERGEIYTINNKTFLALGGADSVDKNYRTKNISWWSDELWSKKEEDNCLKNLDKHGWSVDYVISHTCPTSIIKEIVNYEEKLLDPTAKFFQFLLDDGLEFKEWHFGHFHLDTQVNRFFCHYGHMPKKLEI